MPHVLIPLPDSDFASTEAPIPWRCLSQAGDEVVLATEQAMYRPAISECWAARSLANWVQNPMRAAYRDMHASEAFQHPICCADVFPRDYTGFLLPGGHAPQHAAAP